MTVAYNLPPGAFGGAWEAVEHAEARFRFAADEFGLFYYTGDEWILYKRSRLAGPGPGGLGAEPPGRRGGPAGPI